MLPSPTFLLALALALSGCCTLTGGRAQTITLTVPDADPKSSATAGARVLVDGRLTEVKSVLFEPKDAAGFGTATVYSNSEYTTLGYGVSTFQLPRRLSGATVKVHVFKPGLPPQELTLTREVDPAYWWNLFNVIGFAVDAFNGTMWRYGPDELSLGFAR